MTDGELIRALDKLFDEIPPPETEEEISAVLWEAGFEPREVPARMESLKTAITEAITEAIAILERAVASPRFEAVARELLAATDGERAHEMWAVLGRLRAVMNQK